MSNILNRFLPTPYEKRMTALVAMIILIVGVSLTSRLLDQQQDPRQRASEVTTPLNAPNPIESEPSSSSPTINEVTSTPPVVTVDPLATSISLSVSLSNVTNPLSPTRLFILDVSDSAGNFVTSQEILLTFQNYLYSGKANITGLQTGIYTFRIKTPGFLESNPIPLSQQITKGQQISLPHVTLLPGDINGDGLRNSLDYNILNDCYEGLTPPKSCDDPSKKAAADLNADGKVDTIDYNILLRNLN